MAYRDPEGEDQALLPPTQKDSEPLLPDSTAPKGDALKDDSRLPQGAPVNPRYSEAVLPPGADPQTLFAGLEDIKTRESAETARIGAGMERTARESAFRQHEAFNAEQATTRDIPTWDEEAQKQKYKTDPLRAFGSLGSVFALVASAFTRRPMTNALQGSAAAMEAMRAGDRQAYEDAYRAYKDNVELALKRHALQHQEFSDAGELMQTDLKAGEIAMKTVAMKYGDEQMLFLLHNGYNKEVFDLMEQRQKADAGIRTAVNAITTATIQKQAYDADVQQIDSMQKPEGMDDLTWQHQQTAKKLMAAVRILGDQGKLTPITREMLQDIQDNPDMKFEDRAARWATMQAGARGRTPQEERAVQAYAQELMDAAKARGETLLPGEAMMMAEAKWSESKGTAATIRAREAEAGRERRAELSADTKQAVAQLSADTRREIAEMGEIGKDARLEFSTKAKEEIARMNNTARKELAEYLEQGRTARANKSGVMTSDRQMLADANAQIMQEIDQGKLDPSDAAAVAKRRADIEAELRDRAGKSKNLTAPETNLVTEAPTTLKNFNKIMGLIDQSGTLFTHVPASLIGEYGGEGDGINAYNITRNQLRANLLSLYRGGVMSAKTLNAIEDLLPPGSASLIFKRAAFQTEFANLREEVQDRVNQIEAQGKRIDPNIWNTLKQFGIYPSAQRKDSLIERFRTDPGSLSKTDFQQLLRMPYLRTEDVEAIARYIREQAAKEGASVTGH